MLEVSVLILQMREQVKNLGKCPGSLKGVEPGPQLR
jgi:hypothetical protein